MKNILCFGDSNTWGWDPARKQRFSSEVRWAGVLREELGDEFNVIEEGLNGRTTVWHDPLEEHRNGKEYLIPCLDTHRPLDLVVLLLGTNDLKLRFSVSALDIGEGVQILADIILASNSGLNEAPPPLLIMVPPPIYEIGEYAEMFLGGEKKSKRLAEHYRRVAEERNCHFLDTSEVISSSRIDGIHFEAEAHRALGSRVADIIKKMDL